MGILGCPSYHGNPCYVAADVNNIEEILVNSTKARTLICGASGPFATLLEMLVFLQWLNHVKTASLLFFRINVSA